MTHAFTPKQPPHVKITEDGPYVVSGGVPLRQQAIVTDAQGQSLDWETTRTFEAGEEYALCRCGQSANKPYCDGSHAKVGFDGTETADRAPYRERAELMSGPALSLTDQESLCAFARFCDPHGRVWNQVEATDDPEVARNFVRQVNNCSAGRLVAWNNQTGTPVETPRAPAIGVTEDTARGCSGPLWVQGGIAIESADGTVYERRNRVALCRCGQSRNKPYCDGTHAAIDFQDGL